MNYIREVGTFVIAMLTGNLGKDSHELSVLISIVNFKCRFSCDALLRCRPLHMKLLKYFIRRKKNEPNLGWENCYILNEYYH